MLAQLVTEWGAQLKEQKRSTHGMQDDPRRPNLVLGDIHEEGADSTEGASTSHNTPLKRKKTEEAPSTKGLSKRGKRTRDDELLLATSTGIRQHEDELASLSQQPSPVQLPPFNLPPAVTTFVANTKTTVDLMNIRYPTWFSPCGNSLQRVGEVEKKGLPDFLRSPITTAASVAGAGSVAVEKRAPIFHGEVPGFFGTTGDTIPKKVRTILESVVRYVRSPDVLGAVDELTPNARLFISLQQASPPSGRKTKATNSCPVQVVACCVAVALDKAQRHSGIAIPLTDHIRSNLSTQEEAPVLLPPSSSSADTDIKKKGKKLKSKESSQQDGVGTSDSQRENLAAYHQWVRDDSTLSDVLVQGGCIAGVQLIWVDTAARRQSIASDLCDAMRRHLVYGLECSREQVAFSQPTRDGKIFALGYTGRSDFLTFW